MRKSVIAVAALAMLAVPASAASVSKTYSYFSIGGRTLSEIESELSRRDPQLKSTGSRHPGATRMEFTTRINYAQGGGFCRIDSVRVVVKADVILPRWRQRARADADTRIIWDTLSSDIKRHEESHIVIAKRHAGELETELRALPRQRDCAKLAERVQTVTARLLARHDDAQARFDRIEGMNFESRMLSLLRYRLEQMEKRGKLGG